MSLGDIIRELENMSGSTLNEVLKPPFNCAGCKLKSLKNILPHLPITDRYIEPCGGSGVVLLNRPPSKLEVFNDRYGAITDFYRVIQNPEQLDKLIDLLTYSVNTKELWHFCHEHQFSEEDIVKRSFFWLYNLVYSFSSLGRHWGRLNDTHTIHSGKLRTRIRWFDKINDRLKQVQIENQDWQDCLRFYDHPQAVFYVDPPYPDTSGCVYRFTPTLTEHESVLNLIFHMKAFVAVSGYSHKLYESYNWDERYEWEVRSIVEGSASTETNHKSDNTIRQRVKTEVLWIKHRKD